MKLSFTTIVWNEVNRVEALVDSLSDVVDEFVFVDTGSLDGTPELLEGLGCVVLHTTMDDGFAAARNIGLEKCTGDWVLSLDADELPSAKLPKWCRKLAEADGRGADAMRLVRDNYIDHNFINAEEHIRLFRRGCARWEGTIHEQLVVDGKVGKGPRTYCIRHEKSSRRQKAQNIRYLDYYPKLNLGSGGRPMPVKDGWINYDLDPNAPTATVADVFERLPHPLPAKYILASHVLEHASYHKSSAILKMWVDKLAPGGTIEVRVPDLSAILKAAADGEIGYLRFIQLMYGGQTTEWNYHYTAFDDTWFIGQFNYFGLVEIERLDPTDSWELRMTAKKPL